MVDNARLAEARKQNFHKPDQQVDYNEIFSDGRNAPEVLSKVHSSGYLCLPIRGDIIYNDEKRKKCLQGVQKLRLRKRAGRRKMFSDRGVHYADFSRK